MSERPRSHERAISPELSQKLFEAVGTLVTDVLVRSGLPLDTRWTSIEFGKDSNDYEALDDSEWLYVSPSLLGPDDIGEILAFDFGKKTYYVNLVRHIVDRRIGSGQVVFEDSITASLEPGGGEHYSGDIDPEDLLSVLEGYKGSAAKVGFAIPAAQ